MIQKVSAALSICTCKFDLSAVVVLMRSGLNLHGYCAIISPDNVVTLILKSLDVTTTSISQLFQAHVCFKCMKEAGASAEHILQYLCDTLMLALFEMQDSASASWCKPVKKTRVCGMPFPR